MRRRNRIHLNVNHHIDTTVGNNVRIGGHGPAGRRLNVSCLEVALVTRVVKPPSSIGRFGVVRAAGLRCLRVPVAWSGPGAMAATSRRLSRRERRPSSSGAGSPRCAEGWVSPVSAATIGAAPPPGGAVRLDPTMHPHCRVEQFRAPVSTPTIGRQYRRSNRHFLVVHALQAGSGEGTNE